MIVAWLHRRAEGWQRFWFTPTSSSIFALMRTLLGVSCFFWALSILPDLRTFYFDDGLLPEPTYRDDRYGLFQWFTGDTAVVVVWIALVAASLSLAFGRLTRLGAPVLWLMLMTMQQGAVNVLNAGDGLLRIWTAYFALFALFTPNRFLDAPLLGERTPSGRQWPLAPTWLVRLAQIQLTIIYPATIIAKLEGDTWREGTASIYALGLVDFERFWVPAFVREDLLVGNVMTYFTVAVELSIPFLLWTRRTRWLGLAAGIAMHVGFDYTMRLGFFFPAMLVGYVAFVRPDELERFMRGAVRWIRRSRGLSRPEAVEDVTPELSGQRE